MLPEPGTQTKSIEEWAENLAIAASESVARRNNETELREDVEGVIRAALKDLYDTNLNEITAETNTSPIAGKRSPVDKVYGGVLVEFEWRMDHSRRRHGADQAVTYLENIEATTGAAGAFTAVVTDGAQWGFLVQHPHQGQLNMLSLDVTSPDDAFEWRPNSAAACRRFLQLCGNHTRQPVTGTALANEFGPASEDVRIMIALLAIAFDGRLAGDRADTLFKEWARSTEVVYGSLESLQADVADELRRTFDVPAAVCRSLQELLFVIHTYFSLIARVLAVEVLSIALSESSSQPSSWSSLPDEQVVKIVNQFDEGGLPTSLTASNLFETDVFSWYVSSLDGDLSLLKSLRTILDKVGKFAFPELAFGATIASDNLRELYQRLIPRMLRKQLGEFPTPLWLAEASLARMREAGAKLDSGRVLDPTCGTGAFLLPILRSRVMALRARGESVTPRDVQEMLDSVAGFDINPIAVTATRANFVVALGSLAAVGPFSLPIYRTDSLVLPEEAPIARHMGTERLIGKDYLELQTSLEEPFPIPTIFKSSSHLGTLRRALEGSLESNDAASGEQDFLREMRHWFGPGGLKQLVSDEQEWLDVGDVLSVLQNQIRTLSEEGRDGVWPAIIENSFAPIFAGTFDVVVGNPPWLGWPKLPARWRDRASKLWKRYGLWSLPAHDGEHRAYAQFNDIATLVFATALARYASVGGFVGFLVPEALVVADPGARAFRRFHLKSEEGETGVNVVWRIAHCDSWREIKPFGADAANNPVFLVAQRDAPQVFPVPTVRWSRVTAGERIAGTWLSIRPKLSEQEGVSSPVDRSLPYSAWSFTPTGVTLLEGGSNSWSFGMGINSRGAAGIFYVDVISANKAAGTVRIRNRVAEGRNRALTEQTRSIEAPLVHPLLRGRDIAPWDAKATMYTVVTQDPEDFGKYLPDSELQVRFPEARAWLRKFVSTLRARSRPNNSWDMVGKDWSRLQGSFEHLSGKCLVVLPEQRLPPPAAVVGPVMDIALGRKVLPLPNHKIVYCAVDTFDEALYLCGVINSGQMQSLLASFASQTAVSPTTIARLPIPAFESDNSTVQSIVEASRIIHLAQDKASAIEEHLPFINIFVEQLLSEAGAVGASARYEPIRRAPSRRSSRSRVPGQGTLAIPGLDMLDEEP